MRKYSSLLSGPPKDQKGQTTGINISIHVVVAGPVLPAEVFLAFNVAV